LIKAFYDYKIANILGF